MNDYLRNKIYTCFSQLPLPIERIRRLHLSRALDCTLHRVGILGDGRSGHTGCINALSWARNGELLLSGGDDTTVRIWAIESADLSQDYPFQCRSVINTGHRANIFSAHMLPYSSRIATVAGDHQVRVFDVAEAAFHSTSSGASEVSYSARQSCTHILRCHEDRVKRIVTESSPDLFLTVGEDGCVRQHDLRTVHDCHGLCPSPLLKVNHELSTLTLSPLTPYQFVVAGESPYGYLFDRRHLSRDLRVEWGIPETIYDDSSLTTCVRRFGRRRKNNNGRRSGRPDHITGARMSIYNGHEVLLSFSGDGVYLYSTCDDPQEEGGSSILSSLPSNLQQQQTDELRAEKNFPSPINNAEADGNSSPPSMDVDADADVAESSRGDHSGREDNHDESEEDSDDSYLELVETDTVDENNYHPHIPVVFPQQSYAGACNVATIKDVNFLGPRDEYVTSGSDDGNFFVWRKNTGVLHGIYEGDGSVVNMVEGHPYLPLIAVSGIDYTVKLFAPASGPSDFSRIDNATRIMETNAHPSRPRTIRYNFAALLPEARPADRGSPECRNQ